MASEDENSFGHSDSKKQTNRGPTNVWDNTIREQMPEILDILLIDRTTSTPRKTKNIIWANDHYIKYGYNAYAPTAEMKRELVTGIMSNIIVPRSLKTNSLKKERTKEKAEVFTPTWVVKRQNDEVDKDFLNDDLATYINRKWLEVTCGEGPYMTTRYDMDTGVIIPIEERVGFVDRKLSRINKEITDKVEWQQLAEVAYKSAYGFEWNGDSLLLARENLLYTYRDYYMDKWGDEPSVESLKKIAEIISYNVFQMDGLKYIIPLSDQQEKIVHVQLSLFDDDEIVTETNVSTGVRVKVMNWETNRLEFFDKGVTS